MNFSHWVNGAFCKSQGPPLKKTVTSKRIPLLNTWLGCPGDSQNMHPIAVVLAPQSKCLWLKKPCTWGRGPRLPWAVIGLSVLSLRTSFPGTTRKVLSTLDYLEFINHLSTKEWLKRYDRTLSSQSVHGCANVSLYNKTVHSCTHQVVNTQVF